MKEKVIIFLLMLFFFSCLQNETIDELKIDAFKPQLVVYGLLSPEKDPFVNVRLIKGFEEPNGAEEDLIHNAEVILYNALGEGILLTEVDTTGNYYADKQQFAISKGERYTLEVNYDKLSVTAECEVPVEGAVWNSFTHTKTYEIVQPFYLGNYITNIISGNWVDVSTQTEQYYYVGGVDVTDAFIATNLHGDTIIENYRIGFNVLYDPYAITTVNDTIHYQGEISYNGWIKGYYHLITMEENYYNFSVTSSRMKNLIDPNIGNFLISYKGILPEFTNIEGGVGFFGAYLTDSVYFEMK
ncbi:MAG: DUF4249 domain-containing protein [Cyclobacteriaceae bacterium]|nr:DUF4249 domain-containing protein [Cyclobacteriaceae bacterium]